MAAPWEKYQSSTNTAQAPWEKYASQSGEQNPVPWIDQEGIGSGIARGTINTLPAGGMIGGGLLGSGAGPLGTVGGAGLGAGAGEALKNSIYTYLGSKNAPKTREEALTGPLKAIPEGATAEMGGQLLGKATSMVAPRIASAISGAPEQDVKTLIKNPEEVGGLIKETQGKVSGKIDEARAGANAGLMDYKNSLNQKIKSNLSSSSPEKNIDINPILDAIGKAKQQINPKLNPEVSSEINAIQKRISDLGEESGKVSVSEINDIRNYLGELGSGIAPKPTGEGKLFSPKDTGSRAAYYGSGASSDILKKNSPEVGDALSKLGELRQLSKQVQPSLLKEGANDVGFLGAGRGAQIRNEEMLRKIDELTGGDVLGQSQKLSAAKTFGDTKLNPLSLVSGGFLRNPAVLREAILKNNALKNPAGALPASTKQILLNIQRSRRD